MWTVDAGLGGQYESIVRECARNVKRSVGGDVVAYCAGETGRVFSCAMLASIISLAAILLNLHAGPNSVVPPKEVQSQDSQSSANTEDISHLQAQAEAGDPAAQLKLARAYESGIGVRQNDQLAAKWLRMAAEQGNAESQDSLGAKYLIGRGVERNKELAVNWFRKSARQGNASAMYHLGAAYYNGDGVPIDDVLSYAWFTLAKEAGDQSAVEAVLRAESDLKPVEIADSYKKIAEMYELNGGLAANQAEAARWWSKAANGGDLDAQYAIAIKLIYGQGVPQDLDRGRHLCNEAAKRNDQRAEYCMGYIYQHGLGVAQDDKKARTWYDHAAANGELRAMKALALMEIAGEGGKIDRVGAFLLYTRLAEKGYTDVLPSMAKLKKEITPKEWELLQKSLRHMRIDPAKLDATLQGIDAK